MKLLPFVFAVVLAVAPVAVAQTPTVPQAPAVRTVAIADFVDESMDGAFIGAGRLNASLQRILSDRAGGRLRVVATEDVRAAMRTQGVTARDLVSPTKSAALAQAVGADWIVTGRWTHLDVDVFTRPNPADPDREIVVRVSGHSLLELRVLEAATRRIVLQDSVGGDSFGFTRLHALIQAAQIALVRAADRLLSL